MTILAQLAAAGVLDRAYVWLCRRRRDYSANSDVWSFRRRWPSEREQIKDELRAGKPEAERRLWLQLLEDVRRPKFVVEPDDEAAN
jgi:hypothetical protein